MYLVKLVAGSRLYGTHSSDSDYDYRGVMLEPVESLIGLAPRFEQHETKKPDATYFGLQKFMRLALQNNPNILEILFASPQTWQLDTDVWRQLYERRHDVLSEQVRRTYGGYIRSQLRQFEQKRGDAKALAHALRLSYQVWDILIDGELNPTLSGEQLERVRNVRYASQIDDSLYNAVIREIGQQLRCVDALPQRLPATPRTSRIEAIMINTYQIYLQKGNHHATPLL